MNLTRRTVLITGGTSGIGLELASQLSQRGNTVIVTGRNPARLEDVKRTLPSLHVVRSDVSDPAAIAALRDDLVARFPALDTLINNAGVMRNLNLNRSDELDDVTREIEINLSGPVRMIQAFLPQLKSREGALLVNVTSGLAFVPFASAPIYCATKAALHSYTQSLRIQLAGSNVTVVELAPPGTETPLFRGEFEAEMKNQKGMPVKVLVERALEGLEANRPEIRPGLSNVLKLMSRLAPDFMLKQLSKMSRLEQDPKLLNAGGH